MTFIQQATNSSDCQVKEILIESILVVIPAHNEAATVGAVVSAVRTSPGWHVLVVNDASADETAQQAAAAGATVLNLSVPLGAWGAAQTGLRYALLEGYDYVVTMDADGQHEVASLPAVLEPVLEKAAQVSIGSCVARASQARRAAWTVFRGLSQLPHMDLTSGLRGYSRDAMELLIQPEATLLDFQDVGVLARLHHAGLRVVEVPVTMLAREHGKSRVFKSWWRVAGYMLQTVILSLAKLGPARRTMEPRQ